ncbi:MAG: hypothetical protein ACI31R_06425 [Bacilli bacterium]
MNNKKVILRQVGKFVNVFDEDAVIISYLLNYKLVNDKVGFPMNALNKVINTLEEKKISYELKGEEKIAKDFKKAKMSIASFLGHIKYADSYHFREKCFEKIKFYTEEKFCLNNGSFIGNQ